jgi:hypothetical protein
MNRASISIFQATFLVAFRYFLTRIRPRRKTKNDLSQKHEITKTRKNANMIFVFSPPQADVCATRNSFHKMQKLTSMIQKNSNITAAVYTIRHDWLSKVF